MNINANSSPVASMVSLGCAKNTVDSERILGSFVESGWMIAADPADADICLVNTCGFIADAREETQEVLADLYALKADSDLRAVIAIGCMVERAEEVEEDAWVLESADMLVGFRDYPRLPKLCREYLENSVPDSATDEDTIDFINAPRLRIGYPHHAYLKISEGCSNLCSFCTIPTIRGRQRSVPIENLVAEATSLIEMGAKEIEIIAQDTTSYGKDIYGERSLARLLRELQKIDAQNWFRLMYVFPSFLNDDVLDIIAADPRFCPYIDMPLQHIADPILKSMGRKMEKSATLALLERILKRIPNAALRSTFIVGYPGETEADFDELLDFVRQGHFMHAGVFQYSQELNTRAGKSENQLPEQEKIARADALMTAQLEVSCRKMEQQIGTEMDVMIDEINEFATDDDPVIATGHTQMQEIEVDGHVILNGEPGDSIEMDQGDIVRVKITDASDYDLFGEKSKSAPRNIR